MATKGRKQKPVALKLVTGNPGKRPLPGTEGVEVREEPLVPPVSLNEAQQSLWDRYINKAWWLDDHDAPKAFMWCALEAEFELCPADMTASRIAQLRALGSELGFDPSSRARMAGSGGKQNDPADKYFD